MPDHRPYPVPWAGLGEPSPDWFPWIVTDSPCGGTERQRRIRTEGAGEAERSPVPTIDYVKMIWPPAAMS